MRWTCLLATATLFGCTDSNPGMAKNDLGMPDLASSSDGMSDDGAVDALPASADAAADAGGDFCMNLPDNTACPNGGLCKSAVCSPCNDGPALSGGDDANCATANSGAFLCIGGACTPGECRAGATPLCPVGKLCGIVTANFCSTGCQSNSDCTTGQICGANNICAPCSSDQQCSVAYGAGFICNQTGTNGAAAGSCQNGAGVCTVEGGACPVDSADFCCGAVGPTCVTGNCCTGDVTYGDARCVTLLSNGAAKCSANVCTICTVPATEFLVDPTLSNDSGSTGASGACAFKTMTHAVQFLSSLKPTSAVDIKVLHDVPANAGESYPIVLPAHVTLKGADATTTIHLPPSVVGFELAAGGTGIQSLIIDGGGPGSAIPSPSPAAVGIAVLAGPSPSPAPLLDNVTVQFVKGNGIEIANTSVTLADNLTSNGNGLSGLHVNGANASTLGSLQAGAATLTLDNNGEHGLFIDNFGFATMSTGRMSSLNNKAAGVFVQQDPASATLNTLSSVTAGGNLRGVHVYGGSKLSLRNSSLLGNKQVGVLITALTATNKVAASNNIGGIDFGGSDVDYGHNQFQSGGASSNPGAGICVEGNTTGGPLKAQGNSFTGQDCSTSTGNLSIGAGTCLGTVDIGYTRPNSTTFDVRMCGCAKIGNNQVCAN